MPATWAEQLWVEHAFLGREPVGVGGQFPAASATLEWMLLHLLEEVARHAGHLDLLRELLDGETG